MSGLFGTLNSSVQALSAQSRAIETASRNLANVNNPAYARQRVVIGDRGSVQTPLGAQSMGIEAKGIQQLRDFLLDRGVVSEVSLSSEFRTEQQALENAQAGLGQTIDRAGGLAEVAGNQAIAESLSAFFNAFQSFAARPTDPGERQALVQKAGILTDRFAVTDERLERVQDSLTFQAGTDVEEVNRILSTLADLNGQIGRFEVGRPGSAVDLRDQRQAKLEELASKIDFEYRDNLSAPGQIEIFLRDGSGGEIQLLNLASVTGPLSLSGSTLSAGSPATVVDLRGGSIKGALDVRDGAIQTVRDRLDALAAQLVDAVNTAYNPTGATGDFFNAAGTTARTFALDGTVTAASLKASDGGAAGDNTLALAVANLAYRSFSTSGGDLIDGTFSQYYARTVSDLGQELSTTTSRLGDQETIEKLVRGRRDAVSGVSLDEEMADLLKYQRSFQASARVVQIVDDMLDVVVNRLSRG